MAYIDEAKRQDRAKYRVLRLQTISHDGTDLGSATAWATAPVAAAAGLLEGRIVDVSRTRNRLPEAIGAAPERVSVSLLVADHDNQMCSLLLGTSGGPQTEYMGASVLNLRGQLFAGFVAADGSTVEAAISPTMISTGRVERGDDHLVSIGFSALDRPVLGPPRHQIRLRHLGESIFLTAGRRVHRDGSDGDPVVGSDWTEVADLIRESGDGDEAIPFAYGTLALKLSNFYGRHRLAFISYHEPEVGDFPRWRVDRPAHTEQGEQGKTFTLPLGVDSFNAWTCQVRAPLEDGSTVDLWVVLIDFLWGFDESEAWHLLPPASNRLSARVGIRSTPTELVRGILEDHAEAGSAAYDVASFGRCRTGLAVERAVGGVITGDATLAEVVFGHILRPWPVVGWLGLNDRLHLAIVNSLSPAERTAAAGELVHLREADVLGGYVEWIPVDDGERGAAVTDLLMEWSERQEEFWPDGHLFRRAPGNALVPIGEKREMKVSGSWLRPDRAKTALATFGSRMSWPTRRIQFATHDWLATVERGALFRFTYAGGMTPYSSRLLRLEGTEESDDEAVIATFEDMGPVEAMRECTFDTVTNWLYGALPGPGQSVSVAAGSDVVTLNGTTVGTDVVGCHLHTPGSTIPGNRRIARRITERIDATHFRVEFAFEASESIYGSTAGTALLNSAWHITTSQETEAGNVEFLTACNEVTGTFRNGEPGFTVGAG